MTFQRNPARKLRSTIAPLAVFGLLVVVAPTFAATGGVSSTGGTTTSTPPPSGAGPCHHGTKGKIVGAGRPGNKRAIPPCGAPARIFKVYAAANHIRKKPYVWGGGHGRWEDSGYDCSGSVSYVLHKAGLLKPDAPLDSGHFARWGRAHKGRWITIYANSGHVYSVIAGLRWDTSMNGSNGPGWSSQMRSNPKHMTKHHGMQPLFKVRHPAGY